MQSNPLFMDTWNWSRDSKNSNDELRSRATPSRKRRQGKVLADNERRTYLQTFLTCLEWREDHLKRDARVNCCSLCTLFLLQHCWSTKPMAAITKGKALNNKALVICLWTVVNKHIEERHAEQMKEWMSNLGWEIMSAQIWKESEFWTQWLLS